MEDDEYPSHQRSAFYDEYDDDEEELMVDPPPPSIIIPKAREPLPRGRSSGGRDDSTSSCCSSLSPPTTASGNGTPSQTSRDPGSMSELRNDREIITMVCTSNKSPEDVDSLDLSTATKRTRKSMKSLRALSDFVNLTQLNVSNNVIASVDGIDAFTYLEVLSMSRNHLKRIGSPLFTLTSLRHLDLSGNFIAHIPKAIVRLELLETLNLSGNNLSVLKEVDPLGKLMNLHECNFIANPFGKLPTYKDYVICKLPSLKKLDESAITALVRDKSRRRFSEEMFSKDTHLREAGMAHEQEQNKLREVRSALEAENLRLKGELQVKSKLLQNKSKEWSNATGQLLQLQQEIAMLNLDRRGSTPSTSMYADDEQRARALFPSSRFSVPSSLHRLDEDDPQRTSASFTSAPASSPNRSESSVRTAHRGERDSKHVPTLAQDENELEFHLRQPIPSVSPMKRSVGNVNIVSPHSRFQENSRYALSRSMITFDTDEGLFSRSPPNIENQSQRRGNYQSCSKQLIDSSCSPPEFENWSQHRDNYQSCSKQVVDSACSPLRSRVHTPEKQSHVTQTGQEKVVVAQPQKQEQYLSAAVQPNPLGVSPVPGRSKIFDHLRRAFSSISSPELYDEVPSMSSEVHLAEDDSIRNDMSINRSIRFPTFEDDLACPAYEQDSYEDTYKAQLRSQKRPSHFHRQEVSRPAGSPGRLLALSSPSPSPRSKSQRFWQRQQEEFRQQTLGNSPRGAKSPLKCVSSTSMTDGSVDRDMLARQIQALQSCKQSLVAEIASEEQLLHVLKEEAAAYASQMDQLHLSIQACLREAESVESSYDGSHMSPQSPQSLPSKMLRDEEACRAKLEFFRQKLRFAEDKEKEIEMTMVRTTKRVLQSDLQNAPFDKEIFALTHKLQQVIVQKEEIHLEMSRLMALVRDQQRQPSQPGTANPVEHQPNRSHQMRYNYSTPTVEEMLKAEEQQEQLSAEHRQTVTVARKRMDELRKRHHDVLDRICVKEDLIASFVDELKDVEKELALINAFSPSASPRLRRQRSVGLDFHSVGAASPSYATMDPIELEVTEALRSFRQSPRKCGDSNTEINADDITPGDSTVVTPSPNRPSNTASQEQKSIDAAVVSSNGDSVTTSSDAVNPTGFPSELKLKELLTAAMMDEIKKDIFERLSSQLMGVTSQATRGERGALQDQKELHDAIAAALETQMKLAMESFHKQRQDEEKKAKQDREKDASSPPKRTRNHAASINTTSRPNKNSDHQPHGAFALDGARDDDISCDQLDDFVPVNATYAMKYRFVKYRSSSSSLSPPSPNGGKLSVRAVGAHRILKACERLEQAEHDCKIDAVTSMEVDPMGVKKSSLKVLLMGARDLPTSHLRTKNLDPYVSLEIVYPEYIVASSKQSSNGRGRDMGPSLSYAADESCHSSYPPFRSRTKKKSMYPVWDEEFEFTPVLSLKGYLHVRILNDRKLSREQLVGEVRIPLRTLLHQKKTVDWFALCIAVPSASSSCTESSGMRKSTTILRSSGGSIRLQLQLTYSRLEKYKRAVDDLVTKYFHEHNQLPPFIEPVNHVIGRRIAHNQEQHEESDTLSHNRFVSREDADALRELQRQRQQQYDNDDGVPEVESPAKDPDLAAIPTFESWQAAQAEAAQQARLRESNPENGNYCHGYASTGGSPQRTSADILIASHIYDSASLVSHGGSGSFVPRLSAERSRLLWETPPPPQETVNLEQKQQTHHPDAHRAHESARGTASVNMLRHSFLTNQGHTRTNPPATVKVASTSTTSAVRTKGGQKTYHQSQTLNPLTRRKTTGAASERPECFDDYSPYHPDFKFIDSLDLGNMDHFVKKRKVTDLYSWQSSMRGGAAVSSGMVPYSAADTLDFNRKTDLRIFKSPGFSRRQPSTGFPERYIGLDNQTCERLKRMFGRMDGGTTG
uniref:C2 domain-containing protein n=1 Tax=Globisporangium ultimum (strain ATCC 200006 / CBS 805.95 / DAOM BR144) TaxID=431595 RepID=K3WRW8_GLOUD